MRGFFCDLDGTLVTKVPSHMLDGCKVCGESNTPNMFTIIPPKAFTCMQSITSMRDVIMIPCTMRPVHSYKTLNIHDGFKYALCEGAGHLLIDNVDDQEWYYKSLEIVEPYINKRLSISMICEELGCIPVSETAFSILYKIPNFNSIKRVTERLRPYYNDFAFVVEDDLLCINYKVLSKAHAIERFVDRFRVVPYLSAGDSEHDVPMFKCTYYSVGHKNSRQPVGRTDSPIDFINSVMSASYDILRMR